ncbi:hypothetical protein [Bacillus licheniformis]|uniref:hypothetical protein n=1 Tax=Bacillus licheniformis TaxID=1402 RepID=UPI001322E576|nr:hypothetical protein [Bacillus licheniformis]TWL85154.1 hypothetical protein CHCC15311_0219 [Bacillus licheniformis]
MKSVTLALNAFRELTEKIRNVGAKTIDRRIKELSSTVKHSVTEQIDDIKNELKGE